MGKVLFIPRGTKVLESDVNEPTWEYNRFDAVTDLREQGMVTFSRDGLVEILKQIANGMWIFAAVKLLRMYQPDMSLVEAKNLVDSLRIPARESEACDWAVLVDNYGINKYRIHSQGMSQDTADKTWNGLDLIGKKALLVRIVRRF